MWIFILLKKKNISFTDQFHLVTILKYFWWIIFWQWVVREMSFHLFALAVFSCVVAHWTLQVVAWIFVFILSCISILSYFCSWMLSRTGAAYHAQIHIIHDEEFVLCTVIASDQDLISGLWSQAKWNKNDDKMSKTVKLPAPKPLQRWVFFN